ncbi:hypothetical protein ND808_13045 [Streptomyces sp. DR7-3]|nr:hypothetical protein [Streptomyces sp. DR7-3]MCM3806801.1 hypothetical protein [Streptomyces sp. DR7-3]
MVSGAVRSSAEPRLSGRRSGAEAQASHAGNILCLEDVNEPAYALDRALTQLLHSRALDGVAGIILGSSQGCRPEPLLRDVFRERLTPLGVPVAWELGFGHGPSSLTLPLGVPAELEVSTHRAVLTIRGGAA